MKHGTSFDLFLNFGVGTAAVILILLYSVTQPTEDTRKRAKRILVIVLIFYLISRVFGIL